MDNTIFKGSLLIWCMSLPLIILVILLNPEHRLETLFRDVNKYETLDEGLDHERYLEKLLQWKANNPQAQQIANGYMFHHLKTCLNPKCVYKTEELIIVKPGLFQGGDVSLATGMDFSNLLMVELFHEIFTSIKQK